MTEASHRIAISGASGLVGRALSETLRGQGHTVIALVRREPQDASEVRWDPAAGEVDLEGLQGVHGVVHLAGEAIADGRWSDARKQRILSSRRDGTRALAAALAQLDPKPAVLVSASAVGFYGDAGSSVVDESAPAGTGFLAEVCQAWEAATEPAREAGIRTVRLRFGIVLSRDGGALAKMLPAFKMGVGGRLGSGDQYMSWVALSDTVRIITHTLEHNGMTGVYNATGPEPVTNREFTSTLGQVLGRPTFLPVPAFALRAGFGAMADEALLGGQRAVPKRLHAAGFEFEHRDLRSALEAELGA